MSEAGEEAGIRATLGRYLKGSSYNDPELIASAFYDDADLFLSHPEKEIFLMTVAEYSAIFANRERGEFNGRTGEILFRQQVCWILELLITSRRSSY